MSEYHKTFNVVIRLIDSKSEDVGGNNIGDCTVSDLVRVLEELQIHIQEMQPGTKIVITKEVEQ